MIRTTPALAAVVQDKRLPSAEGRPESTLSLKMFPGGFLALGGANTPNTFARWAVRIAIADDCDRFPARRGRRGRSGRNSSSTGPPASMIASPSSCRRRPLKGGRIDTLYERSDRRRFYVACPACGREDFLTWNEPGHLRVAFEDRDPATACLVCPDAADGGCGTRLGEPARGTLVAQGRGGRRRSPREPGLVGFHVPAMLSPWVSLAELVAKFLGAARPRARILPRLREYEPGRGLGGPGDPHGGATRSSGAARTTGRASKSRRRPRRSPPGSMSSPTASRSSCWPGGQPASGGWSSGGPSRVIHERPRPKAALLDALTRRYAHGKRAAAANPQHVRRLRVRHGGGL